LTTLGEPKARIRSAIARDVARAITGTSGRSRAADMTTDRLASSSSVSATTASQDA
jgi:hypothetical protein